MFNSLSEESKDLLRTMMQSEAWGIYVKFQQEQIENLRILATSRTTLLEDPRQAIWSSAEAYGREDAINSLNDLLSNNG